MVNHPFSVVNRVTSFDQTGIISFLIFQEMATREKLVLEDNQRAVHKDLKERAEEWKPKYFERDSVSENPHAWVYKFRE